MTDGGRDAQPSGVVTFLFTDIEGSTQLVRMLGEGYPAVLDQHHAALRPVWESHAGVEVGTEGDSFLVAFDSADDALAAAVDGQAALAAVPWRSPLPVLVRMGIHTGFARPHRGNYAALAVHQAARVVDTAHGGQVLLSDDARLAVTTTPAGAELEPLGCFRVRDFPGPVRLHQVRSVTLPVHHWVPRARPAEGHNLLPPVTSLLGRDDDLASLVAHVGPGRVVTIVGTGGVGKTRIAVEHGLRTCDDWPDGVWFVDLASLTAAAHVPGAVAAATGAKAVPGRPTNQDVLEHLRERQALVVIDNCEHVAPGPAEMVQDLLGHCPAVGVLATSRAPLGLRAEHLHRLRPLPTSTRDSAAVQLFLDRGDAASTDLATARDLCESLDGLPLAIEIAAAQSVLLGADVVLQRVRTAPTAMRSPDPTLPTRQRTLGALLEWSLELLDDETRRLLRRLAVFAAGFSVDTAIDAWGDSDPDLVDRLFTLVEHSLLERDTAAGPERFRLSATLRRYSLDTFDPTERAEAARAAGRVLRARLGPDRTSDWEWITGVADEIDNLRSVIELVAGLDAPLAQDLAWVVGVYHKHVSAFATATVELTHHLELLPASTPARLALLCLLADVHIVTGRIDEAAELAARAHELHASCPLPTWDDGCLARTDVELALVRGELDEAVATGRAALTTVHSSRGRSRLLSVLGVGLAMSGDFEGALEAFREELDIEMGAGMAILVGTTRGNIAEAHWRLGDRAGSAREQLLALEQARSDNNRVQVAFSMLVASALAMDSGRPADSIALHVAATAILDDVGFSMYSIDRLTYEELFETASSEIGERDAEAAIDRGRRLGSDGGAEAAADVLLDATVTWSTSRP